MNQQRSRRFRSAQEARERSETEEQVRKNLVEMGEKIPPPSEKPWDSNVITPGTTFMIDLSEYIRFYIRKRIATDKAWKNIKVIFSDASVPGEGEHKIMAHVRQQRGQKGYNPNLVHVLHGLDADLIMLALATHEAHFYILREEVVFGRRSEANNEKRREESGFAFKQKMLDEAAGSEAMELPENKNKPLQRLSIPILREYLANEFSSVMNPPFRGEVSFERLVDDIVFMCFFVGNDFLPHLPSLDIRDGALDYLFNVYRRLLPGLGGYLTDHGGTVNLDRVDVILAEVGAIEDYVFEMKHSNEEQEKARKKQMKQIGTNGGKLPAGGIVHAPQEVFQTMGRSARIMAENGTAASKQGVNSDGDIKLQRGHLAKEDLRKKLKSRVSGEDNSKAAEALKQELMGGANPRDEDVQKGDGSGDDGQPKQDASLKRKASKMGDPVVSFDDYEEEMFGDSDAESMVGDPDLDDDDVASDDSVEEQAVLDEAHKKIKERVKAVESAKLDDFAKNVKDNVRLHEPGWKDRYYSDKCKADDVKNHGGREHLFRSYVQGLCWVMKYYYEGCPSWKWYYPFHYAPFASDLRNIDRFQRDCTSFDLSEPFKPVEQLLAVLPEDSSHAIPKAARWLMSDEKSPIIDFYPKDVPTDPNGKAMPWLWVVLLPFIDEDRLLSALHPTMNNWTQKELLCNARGLDDGYVYLHKDHPLSKATAFILTSGDKYTKKKFPLADIDISRISCFFGFLRKPLSNEVYDFDSNSIVPLPKTASRISRTTETFAAPIEPNEALCFAFTEPMITSHKSVILRGAVVPQSILTDEDRQIRRPRLNRGGGTIANMGGANGSHQSGYGSMNISSYERDLAMKTGRGRQMNQPGTRAWGAMEPTPKRHHFPPPPIVQQAPMMQRWQAPPPSILPLPTAFPRPPHAPAFPPPPPHPQMQQVVPPPQYQPGIQQPPYQMNPGTYNQQTMRAMTSGGAYNTSQQLFHSIHLHPQSESLKQPQQQVQQQVQSSFSFRQQPGSTFARPGIQQPQSQQHSQTGGRANIDNLRAQLLSTLQKNRQNRGN
ncbi:hypothetical protein ACHAWX_004603 [Stephanocyclus meneghinianus]